MWFLCLCSRLLKMTLEKEERIVGDNIQSSDVNNSNSGPIDQQSYQSDSINSLPLDIMTDNILYRLPAESLVKCRCVCRQWNSSICDPRFINRHISRRSTRLSFVSKRIELDNIKLYDYKDEISGLVDCSYKITGLKYERSSCVHLSNFVNGLTCVYDLSRGIPYLFNPFTRQLSVLPWNSRTTCGFGFGFDVSTGKYKLVRLTTVPWEDGKCCEVLTVGTREWRYVGTSPGPGPLREPVFVHGGIHWRGDGSQSMSIYCFQIGEEKLVTMKGPEISFNVPPLEVSLHDLGGCLSVSFHRRSESRLTIWTMKVYERQEWMILCNIDMSSILYSRYIHSVLGLEDDKIVFGTTDQRYSEQTIFSYDIRKKRFDMLGAKEGVDFILFLVRSDCLLSPQELIGNDNDL